jgi:hypothetical protein
MTEIKVEDLIYIAGIVDGEGCIGVTMLRARKNRSGHTFCPFINITNTDKGLIKYIHDVFPEFSKSTHKPGRTLRTTRDCYRLQTSYQKAATVLRLLLPYLRVKKTQAELVLALCELRDNQKGGGNYSDYTMDEQYILYRNIRRLNNSDDGEVRTDGTVPAQNRVIPPKPEIRPHRNGPQATKGYSKRLKEYFTGCKIDGCQNEHCMMGYCRLHYRQLHESKTYLGGNAVRECLDCAKDIKHLRIDRKFCCVACKSRWHRKAKKDAIIN